MSQLPFTINYRKFLQQNEIEYFEAVRLLFKAYLHFMLRQQTIDSALKAPISSRDVRLLVASFTAPKITHCSTPTPKNIAFQFGDNSSQPHSHSHHYPAESRDNLGEFNSYKDTNNLWHRHSYKNTDNPWDQFIEDVIETPREAEFYQTSWWFYHAVKRLESADRSSIFKLIHDLKPVRIETWKVQVLDFMACMEVIPTTEASDGKEWSDLPLYLLELVSILPIKPRPLPESLTYGYFELMQAVRETVVVSPDCFGLRNSYKFNQLNRFQ